MGTSVLKINLSDDMLEEIDKHKQLRQKQSIEEAVVDLIDLCPEAGAKIPLCCNVRMCRHAPLHFSTPPDFRCRSGLQTRSGKAVRQRNVSRKNTFRDSDTDWQRIDAMGDEDVDLSDIPEITEKQMAGARQRIAGKTVPKGKVSVLVDADIVAYFRMKAGEKNYESVIDK